MERMAGRVKGLGGQTGRIGMRRRVGFSGRLRQLAVLGGGTVVVSI
jgi:hypothetical protein